MIKLIATDLDGTLFFPKKKILLLTRINKKFLKDFVKKGNKLVLVSGRNHEIARRISNKLKQDIDMVACNGSIVYKGKEIIDKQPLNKEDVIALYEANLLNENIGQWIFMTNKHNIIIVPNGMGTLIKVGYRIGMSFQFKYQGTYSFGKRFLRKEFADPNVEFYKAMAIYGLGKKACERARLACLDFNEKLGDKFEILWSSESVEFMCKGVNKATALEKLVTTYGLSSDEVAVIGDSGNDVPLFEKYPNSFVMAQAYEEVKAKAKTVVEGVHSLKEYIDK